MRKSKQQSSRSTRKKPLCILWAVDPFETDQQFQKHALRVFMPIAQTLGVKIRQITYLDAYRTEGTDGQYFPLIPERDTPISVLRPLALERLKRVVPQKYRRHFGPPVLLTHRQWAMPSLREKVSAIAEEARRQNALFVAFGSHARRGAARLFMGSFAETFLLAGGASALIVNPQSVPARRIRYILFATDFSRASRRAYVKTLALAKSLGASLTVVHYQYILSPSVFLARQDVKHEYVREIKRHRDKALRRGRALERYAAQRGVEVKFVLIANPGRFNPAEKILNYARRNRVDLIALAAKSGALKATIMGATTRQVARVSLCPVLIHRNGK